jgi:hypothetical protein
MPVSSATRVIPEEATLTLRIARKAGNGARASDACAQKIS